MGAVCNRCVTDMERVRGVQNVKAAASECRVDMQETALLRERVAECGMHARSMAGEHQVRPYS
jgi:hypothetical protein